MIHATALIALLLGVSSPALASDVATIDVSSSALTVRFAGQQTIGGDIPVCISSTTAAFELDVVLDGAAAGGPRPEVTLVDPQGGVRTPRETLDGTMLNFTGSVAPGVACTGRPNATVRVRYTREALLAGVAGEFPVQFRFVVRPL